MTAKAKRILAKIRRPALLEEFNQSTLDSVGPVGSQDQQMRVLNELNELGEAEEQTSRYSAAEVSIC